MPTKNQLVHEIYGSIYDSYDTDRKPPYRAQNPMTLEDLRRILFALTDEERDRKSISETRYELLQELGFDVSPFDCSKPLKKEHIERLHAELL